ncbi:MAG: hypothetical protein HY074_08295 [Deltaproteobacteria bacterium]|nr:hypothetical protein [Deltaproteobacteria bacterium]
MDYDYHNTMLETSSESTAAELILNPNLSVRLELSTTAKNGTADTHRLGVAQHPELARFLVAAALQGELNQSLTALALPLFHQLLELKILIPRPNSASPVFFGSGPLLDFLPKHGSTTEPCAADELVLNETLCLQGTELPPLLAGRVSAGLPLSSESSAWAWVENPGSRILFPFALSKAQLEALEAIVSNRCPASSLDRDIREYFRGAGILVSKNYFLTKSERWAAAVKNGRAELLADGFVVLREVLTPLQIAALRSYCRDLRSEGYFELDREQVVNMRSYMQNEPFMSFIHQRLLGVIRDLTASDLIPSYSFLTTYDSGAVLERHIDRDQCAWNVSLFIDSQPEVSLADSWPIYFDVGGKVSGVRLAMGDAVLYRGTEVPHWRNALPAGQLATVLLGHYVPQSFEGALD